MTKKKYPQKSCHPEEHSDEGPAFRELPLVSSHRGSEKPVFDKEETNR
jgi:hypothetical protein